jgi:hypothetical protein
MATLPEESGCWLNCGPTTGGDVREDVRKAAAEIWRTACERTRRAMGDATETAALMEAAAARASKFLDRLGEADVPASARAALLSIFCRLLRQRAARLRRVEYVGLEVEVTTTIPSWEDEMNTLLFFEKLQHHLTPESVTILGLRREGHDWDEIAAKLNSSVPAAKKRFWRDIEDAKVELRIGPQGKPPGSAKARRKNKGKDSAA